MKRPLARLTVSALSMGALVFAGIAPVAAAADPQGRGPEPNQNAASPAAADAPAVKPIDQHLGDALQMPTSYPYQPQLRIYPNNSPDASDTANLIGHDDIAAELGELMKRSNRVSTQVVGKSTQGRDIYLVTVTAPETPEQTAQQAAWRDKIKNDPAAAATDAALLADYKVPIWYTANIHGNEWEGADAALKYVKELAEAPWSEAKSLLRGNRIYVSISLNPDGRTNGTRATFLGLDPNRDLITNTTPETVSYVKTAHAIQPIYMADFHGYTSVLQVEPTGPPHGENYEYDLYLPHNYALARHVEDKIVAAEVPGNTYFNVDTRTVVTAKDPANPATHHIKIPYRDTPSGWDDYPPIFTGQYTAFLGAATATVELPIGRVNLGGLSRQTPERAVINVEVAMQTLRAMTEYLTTGTNGQEMVANQIEVFRRGKTGAPKVSITTANVADVPGPSEWKPLWDVADDQDPVTLPRAYVIPMGSTQRSTADATRLVRQLLFNNIEVGRLQADTKVGSTTYPAGSYVVDMHQPLKGLANALLDLGTDISNKLPTMYDVSAWSYSHTWGGTVDKVGNIGDAAIGAVTPVTVANLSNAAAPAAGTYSTFELAGLGDLQALNQLLEQGVEVSLLPDGSALVGAEDSAAAAAVANKFDVAFAEASEADLAAAPTSRGLDDLTIAYTGNQDDTLSLAEMGFDDLVPVTAAGINANPAMLKDIDVMWLGSALTFSGTQTAGRDAVQAWVDQGHGMIGRGSAALTSAKAFNLIAADAVAGQGSGNGIVKIATPTGSLLEPYKQSSTFVYPATAFTNLGAGTTAVQTYADAGNGRTLMAGHWRGTNATNGPDAFVDKAAVIAAETPNGSRTVVFGTSPVWRNFTKGAFNQVGRALFWAGPEGPKVVVKESPTPSPSPSPTVTPTPTQSPSPIPTSPSPTPASSPTPTTSPAPVPTVAPSPTPVILNKVKPRIKGKARVGKKLRVSTGSWSEGVTFTYTWYSGKKVIKKATASKLKVTRKMVGKKIRVTVTASLTGATPVSIKTRPTARIRF